MGHTASHRLLFLDSHGGHFQSNQDLVLALALHFLRKAWATSVRPGWNLLLWRTNWGRPASHYYDYLPECIERNCFSYLQIHFQDSNPSPNFLHNESSTMKLDHWVCSCCNWNFLESSGCSRCLTRRSRFWFRFFPGLVQDCFLEFWSSY